MFGFKAVLLLGAVLGYFFLSSPSKYAVDTPINDSLVAVANRDSESKDSSEQGGVCAPGGCGPDYSVPREDITLILTDEQITSLANALKDKKMPFSNIKVKFSSGKIIVSGMSYYPMVPGKITVVARLSLNHFYVDEVYIGGLRAPKRLEAFIEANGDSLLSGMFETYDVFLKSMRLEGNSLIFEASVPQGLIKLENGVIKINTGNQ